MDNTTNSLAEKSRLRQMIVSYGVPRMSITGFLLLMFVLGGTRLNFDYRVYFPRQTLQRAKTDRETGC